MSETAPIFGHVVSGAITMGYLVVGLFFLRFWRDTRDRLFLIFAVAFWILAVQRVALVLTRHMAETAAGLYLLRLFAFLLILAAIIDKNRAPRD
ncbi:MAG TPA: DUF5985 family protein [Gemmatimonadales bacterium]|nr:DUF5985 family protein [Gemmatimonadales bacterium]